MTEVPVTNPPAPAPAAAGGEATLIAGKFKTQDDLVNAYKALESRLGAAPQKADPLNPPGTVGPDGLSIQKPETPVAGNALEAAYTKATSTGLTEADYTLLQGQGFSKAIIDAHIEGRNAVFDTQKNAIFSAVGGQEQFKTMVSWAAANMTPAEVTSFNRAIASRDPGIMNLAVTGLSAKYRASVGTEPTVLDAAGAPVTSGADLLPNRAEYYKLTGSQQYRKDAAFRATVDARLKATVKANPRF